MKIETPIDLGQVTDVHLPLLSCHKDLDNRVLNFETEFCMSCPTSWDDNSEAFYRALLNEAMDA